MKTSRLKTVIILLLISYSCYSQKTKRETRTENYLNYLEKLPAFTMFGDNYFITGPSLKNTISTENSDAKFQLGFKQRLTNLKLPWNTFLFLTYRQKSFWNIYEESLPFRETNYNPSLGLAKLFADEEGLTNGVWLAFEHESNGQGEPISRSWNYLSLFYVKPYKLKWQFRVKAWLPIGSLDDNDDILDYRGLFELGTTYKASRNFFFDADFRQAFTDGLRGSIKLSVSFKISKNSNQFVYMQYFGGYSEDLIDYNQQVSNLRLGIAFKDLFGNFNGDISTKNNNLNVFER